MNFRPIHKPKERGGCPGFRCLVPGSWARILFSLRHIDTLSWFSNLFACDKRIMGFSRKLTPSDSNWVVERVVAPLFSSFGLVRFPSPAPESLFLRLGGRGDGDGIAVAAETRSHPKNGNLGNRGGIVRFDSIIGQGGSYSQSLLEAGNAADPNQFLCFPLRGGGSSRGERSACQSTSGSWVTMWISTAGDSRKKRWTTLR